MLKASRQHSILQHVLKIIIAFSILRLPRQCFSKLFLMTCFSPPNPFFFHTGTHFHFFKNSCCNIQLYCLDTHQSCWTVGVVGGCYDPEAVVSWLGWPLPSCALLLHEGTPGNEKDGQLRNLDLNHTLIL